MLRFASGAIGTMAAGWVDVDNPVTFQVSGTKASASVIEGQLHVRRIDDDLTAVLAEPMPAGPHAFDLWLDALAGKGLDVSLVTAREAAYRNGVMEAIYAAARGGTWEPPRHG